IHFDGRASAAVGGASVNSVRPINGTSGLRLPRPWGGRRDYSDDSDSMYASAGSGHSYTIQPSRTTSPLSAQQTLRVSSGRPVSIPRTRSALQAPVVAKHNVSS